MRRLDELHLCYPFFGARKLTAMLNREGIAVGRKRVRRLMQRRGIFALYRRPRTTVPMAGHRVFPYLLSGVEIVRPNQVWEADITYLPMRRGFLYLMAIVDVFSRRVMAWRLSNTLTVDFCVAALEEALGRHGTPEIFNTDEAAPVHQPCLHRGAGAGKGAYQHGWPGTLGGQRVHRATVAQCEVRGSVSARLGDGR